ncbi:HD-GYP domain-containing protein [Clostridium sp. C2-6-12]|uniref:HD-GYP domain-containing protein n=1 Tax=Clostridium sp. C2-6-12 TaxID=2698832 RepID=UPI00136805F6|nr:HD-GYP domain-containing protein [Clostridium sp. C2-6-12]
MDMSSWISFVLVIMGALIMSINIIKYCKAYRNFKLIHNAKRKFLNIECKIHLLLICFFLLGYLSVAVGILFNQIEIRLTFVGLIFFFGAIFVFIGILIQSKMFHLVNETYLQTIRALISAIEVRDKYTMGHSEHVANLSVMISQRLAKSCDEDMLEYAGLLHDIGKIGVPEDILNKPGKLSDSEYDVIKIHPQKGTEIIRNIRGLDEISEWILYHHERIDGKGYYSVSKENIPLESRILAVADTFSALVTNRPYRQGMKYERAIEIMKECAGSQLDAEILKVFLNIPAEELDRCLPKNL